MVSSWLMSLLVWLLTAPTQMEYTPIARFMGPIWGPSGADRTQVGPMLAPWTLLSGYLSHPLQWCHNEHGGISNHQPHDCLLNCLFRHRSKKTSKLRITGLCAGNSPVAGEFPTKRASNMECIFIWWHHHVTGNWWPGPWFYIKMSS